MDVSAADRAKSADQIALAVWVLTAFAVAAGIGVAVSVDVVIGLVWAAATFVIGGLLAWRIRRSGRAVS